MSRGPTSSENQVSWVIGWRTSRRIDSSPIPSLPLTRLQEGEFCADEDEVSILELQKQQKDGLVAGVKNIPQWSHSDLIAREGKSRLFSQTADTELKNKGQSQGYVCAD